MIGPISYRSKTDKENDHLIWLIRSKICWLISSEGNRIFNWGNNNILVFSFAIGTIVSIKHWYSQVSFGEQWAIGSSKYLMRAMACKMLLFRGREWSNIKLINIGQTPFQIMTFFIPLDNQFFSRLPRYLRGWDCWFRIHQKTWSNGRNPQFCVLHLVFCLWPHFLLTQSGVMWPDVISLLSSKPIFLSNHLDSLTFSSRWWWPWEKMVRKLNYNLSPTPGGTGPYDDWEKCDQS